MSVTEYYEMSLDLIERNMDGTKPVKINQGRLEDGNLFPFKHRVEITNTNNNKTDSAVITIRIPPDGTFVRAEPILVNEQAREKYLIQMQIRQPDGAGGTLYSKSWRFNIGRPTIQDDINEGETLRLSLIPLEYSLKEHLSSRQLILQTPRNAFKYRMTDYTSTRGNLNPDIRFSSNPTDDIALPENPTLTQSYEPLTPTPTWDLLKQIIDRLANPSVAGGTFNDYFFEFEADNGVGLGGNDLDDGIVNRVNILANEMGVLDSGITLDPLSLTVDDSERDKTIATDLVKVKNNIILEGSARGGSLPMEKSRFTSDWVHAQARPEWTSGDPTFKIGDVVLVNDFEGLPSANDEGIARYFTCTADHTSSPTNKPTVNTQRHWNEDFTIIAPFSQNAESKEGDIVSVDAGDIGNVIFYRAVDNGSPNTWEDPYSGAGDSPAASANWVKVGETWPSQQPYTPFESYTPWTSDYDVGLANLAGFGNSGNFSYGYVVDWNFERANHDRVRATNQYEQISTKAIVKRVNNSTEVSAAEKVNGARFLIDGVGAGDFFGHDNQVAEWSAVPDTFGGVGFWAFSFTPTTNDELVVDLETAEMIGWDGANWVVKWNGTTSGNVPSPFHSVENARLSTGSTGIHGQAIKYTFHHEPSLIITHKENLTSRGAWFTMHMPIPYKFATSTPIGDHYNRSTLDTRNLGFNRLGGFGWNDGLDSEDLGTISALTMKLKLELVDVNSNLIHGYANMPFTGWAKDIFGRIWKTNFTLRRNGEYSFIRMVFGESSPMQLYHNRIDELFAAYGFVFSQKYFLKDKQFSGIKFDWRFVTTWGIFWNLGYDDNGMYIGARDKFWQNIASYAEQTANYGMAAFTLLLTGQPLIPVQNHIIERSHLYVDELAFEKQLYVNSDDVRVEDARTEFRPLTHESDYLNAKAQAKGMKERRKFVNQEWHTKAHGDVRMRLGRSFIVAGSRVPEKVTGFVGWNIIYNYSIGDRIIYLGEKYRALTKNQAKVPTANPTDWVKYVWDLSITYAKGDKVEHSGIPYQSRVDGNLFRVPSVNPEYWINLNKMVCNEVKHIIDSDGYHMEILGVRKFILT